MVHPNISLPIFFDLWLLDENNQLANISYEEEIMFETIFNFVFERIALLEAEIDKEEKEDPQKSSCIMIEILRKRISFNGYSDILTEKLKSCFNQRDEQILALRFDEAFRYLN